MSKIQEIRNKKELPTEFSLNKYREVVNFDLDLWTVNLGARFDEWETPGINHFKGLCCPACYSIGMIKTPILQKESRFFGSLSNVYDMNADIFLSLKKEIETEISNHPEKSRTSICDIIEGHSSTVMVNLDASDDQIINDFRKWLADKREKQESRPPKKMITSEQTAKWRTYEILAYLDLTLWARANNKKITNELMGSTLFPNIDVNKAERIRKVVEPMALELMRPSFFFALISQISEEESKKTLPE